MTDSGGGGPLILSIDTATTERSVAVLAGRRVLSLVSKGGHERAAASVLQEIDAALGRAGVSLRDVGLFAAAVGPGSFTGVRAGLATLQAFSATLGRPAVGVQTLHALARAAGATGRVVAVLPAGRGEVFAQTLAVDDAGAVVETGPPAHVAPRVLLESLRQAGREPAESELVFAGSGARILEEFLSAPGEEAGGRVPSRADEGTRGAWLFRTEVEPLAPHVGALALKVYEAGGATSAGGLRPVYVRASDAELKERCQA